MMRAENASTDRWDTGGGIVTRRFRYLISGSCALLAAALCLAYGEQTRAQCERERTEALERYGGEVVRLVVATKPIEAGETISSNNVSERDWVAELAPEGAITGLELVEGAKVSVPVAAGMPVTELNLRNPTETVEVPDGRVALAMVADSDAGVPPGLEIGATLAAYEVGAEGVRLIANDLKVLSVPAGTAGTLSSGQLTVAVDPDDVAPLLAASGEGSLRFALPGEDSLATDGGDTSDPDNVPPQEILEEGGWGSEEGAGAGEKNVDERGGQI